MGVMVDGVYLPSVGESNWGDAVNDNMRRLAGRSEIRYVSPSGNDVNDGLTWGTAKTTVMAAYDALGTTGGEIYIADSSQVGGEIAGQGIQLAGAGDPNYTSMDEDSAAYPGWRKHKTSRVRFIGVSNNGGWARLLPGTGQATWSGPWINLSATVDELCFENLRPFPPHSAYGIDMSRFSNGADGSGYSANMVYFDNVYSQCSAENGLAGYNPFRSSTSGINTTSHYWIFIRDCRADLGAEAPTTVAEDIDASETVWTMASSGTPAGFPATTPFVAVCQSERVNVTNITGTDWTVTRGYDNTHAVAHANGTQVRFDPEDSRRAAMFLGGYLYEVKNVICYGGHLFSNGLVISRIEGITLESCSGPVVKTYENRDVTIKDVSIFDNPGSARPRGMVVITPFNTNPDWVKVEGMGSNTVTLRGHGPHVGSPSTSGGLGVLADSERDNTPPGAGASGWMPGGRFYGQMDTFRRAFAPATAMATNLVSQDATTWAAIGDGTSAITTGVTGPDGSTAAARLAGSHSTQAFRGIYSGTWNPSAPSYVGPNFQTGDWVFWGTWIRNAYARSGGNGLNSYHYFDGAVATDEHILLEITAGAATFVEGSFVETQGSVQANIRPPWFGSGEWVFQCGYAKALTAGSSTLKMRLYGNVDICYPILFTKAAINDAEAAEIFFNMASWPDYAPAGHLATFRGQKILAHGGIGVGNSAAATTPGSVVKKMEVFDQTGASLGFVPIYSSIT